MKEVIAGQGDIMQRSKIGYDSFAGPGSPLLATYTDGFNYLGVRVVYSEPRNPTWVELSFNVNF